MSGVRIWLGAFSLTWVLLCLVAARAYSKSVEDGNAWDDRVSSEVGRGIVLFSVAVATSVWGLCG